jgi:hypothetical protein
MMRTVERDRLAQARTLAELAERIEAVERGQRVLPSGSAVQTGLPVPLQSLAQGVLHEWLCPDEGRGRSWMPPLFLFGYLAQCALREEPSLVIWIGRRVWPQAHALAHISRNLLASSLLVDPVSADTDGSDRLWTMDVCLRSPAAAVVIADASGMQLAHSRRLQLAAESGRALTLLARSEREQGTLSASPLRWRIDRVRSPTSRPRWQCELVRCKGVQRCDGMEGAALLLEHDRATSGVRVPADLADRPDQASAASRRPPAARRTG